MKKKKLWKILGLLLCFLGLLGAYLWMQSGKETQEDIDGEEENVDSEVLLSWNEKKTHKVSLKSEKGEKITLIKDEDDVWKLENREEIPLVEDEIVNMIEHASELVSERTIEDVEDLSEFGLDEPVNVIEIETEDGEQESLAIGTQNPSTGYTYIYLNGNTNVVYTVDKNLANLYKYEMLDFVESETYPTLTSDNVRKVEVVKAEKSFTLLYDYYATTGWQVEDEAYGRKLADDYEGDNLASMAQTLDFSEFYEYDCEDFSTYGLDQPQMEICVTYQETIEVVSEDSEESEDEAAEDTEEDTVETETVTRNFVIYVGDHNEDGNYYVRLNDSTQVHGIAETHIDKLLGETAVDYWALNMSEISLDDLDSLEVEYAGKSYLLKYVETEQVVESSEDTLEDASDSEDSSEETVEIITTYYVNDVEVDEEAFETFYGNAIGMECQERMVSCETEEEAELTLRFYGTDGEQVVVSYIPWDGSFYAMVRNEEDFGLVNKMNVKNLMELLDELIVTIQ